MDGTGKTTLAKKLEEYLTMNKIKSEFIHGHTYTISKNSFGISDKHIIKYRKLFSILTPLALLDNYVNYIFKYRCKLKNKTIISDRYYYDKVARMIYYGILNKQFAKIYLKLLPKPDLVFFLDVSAKKAFERKKEYTIRELMRWSKIYKFVSNNINCKIINTNKPLSNSWKLIKNEYVKKRDE